MEESKNIIIQAKNARIVAILAEKFDGSLDKAMDVFLSSYRLKISSILSNTMCSLRRNAICESVSKA